ncbi:MAG: hypothetical protein ACRCZD_05485 [Phycicoccus sp.]
MTGKHDGPPHGIESLNWASGPRLGMGNECPSDWGAMIPWGQVYEAAEGNRATNTRVHVKDLEAYYLSKADDTWRLLVASPDVEGSMFREDFSGNSSRNGAGTVRDEAGGGQSAVPGDGHNFHFWTSKRVQVDCSDIAGMVSVMSARLVVDDPTGPDDRSKAKFVACVGADYWRNLTVQWAADWSNNADAGIGKCRYVGTRFSSHYMTTLSEQQLAQNPPPL